MAWLENQNAQPTAQQPQSQPQAAPAPAQPQSVPMLAPDGSARLIPSDGVGGATQAGYKPATKMIDPQGTQRYVPTEAVDQARQANWAVSAQNPGVQRMATPQGQLTYALPNEVDKFKASGHVPIDDTGNFRVDPLPGEDNIDTMARAATIAKNLPPDVMKQAIAAEQKTITPKRVAANLIAGPVIGTASMLPAVAATELGAPVATGLLTAGGEEVLGPSLARQGLQWLASQAANQPGWLKAAEAVGGGDYAVHKVKQWFGH